MAKTGEDAVIINDVTIMSGQHEHNFDDPPNTVLRAEDSFRTAKLEVCVFEEDSAIIIPYRVAVGNPARAVRKRNRIKIKRWI